MGLDIRTPIGLIFVIIGVLLLGYGLASDRTIYQRSLGININMIWGGCLLVFGIIMFIAARIGGRTLRAERLAGSHIEPELPSKRAH